MKTPYSRLYAVGQTLFAARGGKLHSFDLVNGSYISTWKHPDVGNTATALETVTEPQSELPASVEQEGREGAVVDENDDENGPPAKRQKLQGSNGDNAGTEEGVVSQTLDGEQGGGPKRGKGKKSRKNKADNDGPRRLSKLPRAPERPIILLIASSADGSYVAAVTGHDKTIWVFEHDGNGKLTQLSRRAMPKRPSSILITRDSQILCADKFGDVYSLPLLISATPIAATPTPTVSSVKPEYKLAANNLTVHSKRNLRALNQQKRHMEMARGGKDPHNMKAEAPDFEFTLQLGHVSMLTDMLIAENEGRQYIVTCDRDEHIRVSRGMPQAHIIESFCLGHKEFVSCMVVPTLHNEVLVSGGGDEELFLWDWKTGSLLSKTNLLQVAHEIVPDAAKVAVTRLLSLTYPGDGESDPLTYIVAICQDIKAIFSWHLADDNTLRQPGIIQLPGTPLDLAVVPASDDGNPLTLVAAIDPGEEGSARSLQRLALTVNDGRLSVQADSFVEDRDLEAEEADVSEREVRDLLYTVEILRKLPTDTGGDDDDEAPDAAEDVHMPED